MGATSATGTGPGASDKLTTNGLSILANGPSIIYTGSVEIVSEPTSPPIAGATVLFPVPLPGPASGYVVLLTGISTGATWVVDLLEDVSNFTGFVAVGEFEGTVMYLVANVGIKPAIVL